MPFICFPYLTNLIPLISSLIETARAKLGVSDEGDIQNVQARGSSRTGLGSTGLNTIHYADLHGIYAWLYSKPLMC